MEVNNEKIRFILRIFFGKGENASQVADFANGIHGPDTVTANYVLGVVDSVQELLPHGQTLNSNLYCQQLDRLKLAIDQKLQELANGRGVVFHQDTTLGHTLL
ncbi:hypothetical protein TNCV_3674571 [Trichonephila clavipes]|nr:hypothetical protein TNCV_3674571 [Trichonephila clavipes]